MIAAVIVLSVYGAIATTLGIIFAIIAVRSQKEQALTQNKLTAKETELLRTAWDTEKLKERLTPATSVLFREGEASITVPEAALRALDLADTILQRQSAGFEAAIQSNARACDEAVHSAFRITFDDAVSRAKKEKE